MVVSILLGILPTLGILVLILNRSGQKTGILSWLRFYFQGRKAGFSSAEIRRLRILAEQSGKSDRFSLFQSSEVMDYCIRFLAQTLRVNGEDDPALQSLLARLYECRKKIYTEGPRQGLVSSYEIEEGQNLRLIFNSVMHQSQVVKNTDQYILIIRPVNYDLRVPPIWQGRKVSVYFWRKEDAGYVFDSEVLGEMRLKTLIALRISHSDALFRIQKRRSLRVKTHISAYLYLLLSDVAPSNELETDPGLKCFVEDLSDAGCSVAIGGKAEEGLRVKLQFELDKKPFAMSGIVRSADYEEKANRSLLHIEADPLSLEAKNAIFAEMFNVLSPE
jgi:c-di-GMP-binding flagellar brake protein YcgR